MTGCPQVHKFQRPVICRLHGTHTQWVWSFLAGEIKAKWCPTSCPIDQAQSFTKVSGASAVGSTYKSDNNVASARIDDCHWWYSSLFLKKGYFFICMSAARIYQCDALHQVTYLLIVIMWFGNSPDYQNSASTTLTVPLDQRIPAIGKWVWEIEAQ